MPFGRYGNYKTDNKSKELCGGRFLFEEVKSFAIGLDKVFFYSAVELLPLKRTKSAKATCENRLVFGKQDDWLRGFQKESEEGGAFED